MACPELCQVVRVTVHPLAVHLAKKDDANLCFNYAVLQLLIDCHCSIGWHGPGRCRPDGQGCTQTALLEPWRHLITCICSRVVWMLQVQHKAIKRCCSADRRFCSAANSQHLGEYPSGVVTTHACHVCCQLNSMHHANVK